MKAIAGVYATCKWVLKVTCMSFPGTKEATGQTRWKELGLPDI